MYLNKENIYKEEDCFVLYGVNEIKPNYNLIVPNLNLSIEEKISLIVYQILNYFHKNKPFLGKNKTDLYRVATKGKYFNRYKTYEYYYNLDELNKTCFAFFAGNNIKLDKQFRYYSIKIDSCDCSYLYMDNFCIILKDERIQNKTPETTYKEISDINQNLIDLKALKEKTKLKTRSNYDKIFRQKTI